MSRDFWSRRKAAVEAERAQEERDAEQALLAERDAALEEQSDEEILESLGLPDPDELGEGDDFKVFLQETVPARIRTRALRRLWTSNPVLANVDGLVDYGEDFTDASTVIENLQTAYQVGKGMAAHVEELAQQAREKLGIESEEAPETEPQIEEPEEDTPVLVADAPTTPSDVIALAETEMQEDTPIPPRRSMRFSFDAAEHG